MAARYVLIADSDQKVLLKLQEALGELDVHVSVAPDGAMALERALTVRQDLFLFSDKLPVIDTPKLAEILRANPRTANVPMVLLRTAKGPAKYGDGILTKPVQREDLINTVLRYAFKVGSAKETGGKLSGLLSEMPIPDLLQVLRANRREGLLEISGPVGGSLWVRQGEVIECRAGKAEGLKAVLRLLDLREGQFSFKASKVSRPAKLEMPLDELLMEAARQRDEVDRIERARPLSGRLMLLREMSALPEGLHPVHRELLLLVEFYGNVKDVVENARVTDLEAHLGLRSLVEAGIIGSAENVAAEGQRGVQLEPPLLMHLRRMAGHSARRMRPLRVAVFVSGSSFLSPVFDALQPATWIKNADRVLGNRILHPLEGDFSLHLEFYSPGAQTAALLEVPQGLLAGALVVASGADDIEFDLMNESLDWCQRHDVPVEYLTLGEESSVDWVRKAFGLSASSEIYRTQTQSLGPLLEAVRSLLVRRATEGGWVMGAR